MNILNGYKTIIGGIGMIGTGLALIATGLAGEELDLGKVIEGFTAISAGIAVIGGRQAIKKNGKGK